MSRQGLRTTVSFFASRQAGRAGLSKSITELIPNSQFTANVPASGTGTARVRIPASRALYGRVDFSGDAFPGGSPDCEANLAFPDTVTGTGLNARFFGLGRLTIPASANWSLNRTLGRA